MIEYDCISRDGETTADAQFSRRLQISESSAVLGAAFEMAGTCSFFKNTGRNDFRDWCKGDDALPEGSLALSCWEFPLVAALRAGVLSAAAVKAFYRQLPEDSTLEHAEIMRMFGYHNADISIAGVKFPSFPGDRTLVTMSAGFNPSPGDIIFVNEDAHAVLALGEDRINREHEVLHLPTFHPIERQTFAHVILNRACWQQSTVSLRIVRDPWFHIKACTEAALSS